MQPCTWGPIPCAVGKLVAITGGRRQHKKWEEKLCLWYYKAREEKIKGAGSIVQGNRSEIYRDFWSPTETRVNVIFQFKDQEKVIQSRKEAFHWKSTCEAHDSGQWAPSSISPWSYFGFYPGTVHRSLKDRNFYSDNQNNAQAFVLRISLSLEKNTCLFHFRR